MILKRGSVINYGIPYLGSKTKLIDKIATLFPPADNFYDLFGGGFSCTHYMLEHRRKSYNKFYYNELRPGLCELIRDAIDGKYNHDVFKPEWISSERFMAEKESNAYIKIIWSFGNDGKNYIFGKEIEQQKRSMHQAIIFDEFDNFMRYTLGIDKWPNHLSTTGKRIYIRRLANNLGRLELRQLERLEQLERLQLTNLSYEKVIIKPDSVIYCDIPYKGTIDYGSTFNHSEFFDWAGSQSNPVFISEYNIDDSRFTLLKNINHRSTYSSKRNSGGVVEKVYCNKSALKYFKGLNNG